jgi:hypothetical protein
MASISELITDNWPVTEAALGGPDGVTGFAEIKARAVARATRDLYGASAPATEDAVPALACQWIADKATTYLIPVGIDYYADQTRLSDSKEGMTVSYHDRVKVLRDLKTELDAACRESRDAALDAIDAAQAPERVPATPAVSTAGLLIEPTLRAYDRWPFN